MNSLPENSDRTWEVIAAQRELLDALDVTLLGLLALRYGISRDLQAFKEGAGIKANDPVREAAITRRLVALAREHRLPERHVARVARAVLALMREPC